MALPEGTLADLIRILALHLWWFHDPEVLRLDLHGVFTTCRIGALLHVFMREGVTTYHCS